MAVEEVCQRFNDLRSDLVLMYDLRTVLLNYVFELQTLKHQCESVMPDKVRGSATNYFYLLLVFHNNHFIIKITLIVNMALIATLVCLPKGIRDT